MGGESVCSLIEEWRPIQGYEGLYEVSTTGKVRRIADWVGYNNGYRKAIGELSQAKSKGYLNVRLCKNGIQKTYRAHRLVAQAFIENPYNYPQVNHIDGNKQNNCVSNLEWVTVSQNNKHARDTGLCPTNTPKMFEARHNVGLLTQNILKKNPKKRVVVTYDDRIERYESCRNCARSLNTSATYISWLCKGNWKYNKFGAKFAYED